MRIAFIDLIFSWPPHGGADVDVYHVAMGLQARGHEVCLFGAHSGVTWERGVFDPDALPFPAVRCDFPSGLYQRDAVLAELRKAVVAWRPDVVYIGDSFFLKPCLMDAFRDYPMLARFYAHEVLCQKDILRYRNNAPCNHNFLDTPDECRACGLHHQQAAIRSGAHLAWHEEYLATDAYQVAYWEQTRAALALPRALICYNETTAALLRPHARQVVVIPGGVDTTRFPLAQPAPAKAQPRIILMTGRGEDPAKGADLLLEAGHLLAQYRDDFQIRITLPETTAGESWFAPLPWCDHDAMLGHYQSADICVVPSIWDEPFGMVALEAMACGKPVVVSDVGGLRDTIEPEVSGLRFPRGDAAALAAQLTRLLDHDTLRDSMGRAARKRVEEQFAWDVIIDRHYLPLLEALRPEPCA